MTDEQAQSSKRNKKKIKQNTSLLIPAGRPSHEHGRAELAARMRVRTYVTCNQGFKRSSSLTRITTMHHASKYLAWLVRREDTSGRAQVEGGHA
jgi:hypothetical protein